MFLKRSSGYLMIFFNLKIVTNNLLTISSKLSREAYYLNNSTLSKVFSDVILLLRMVPHHLGGSKSVGP